MNRRAWILMGLLAALWGASYLFIAIALDEHSAPFIVFARTLLGGLVLLPIAIGRHAIAPLRGYAGAIVVMALVQVVGPFLLITYGEEHIASSLAGILVSSAPIFTAIIAVFVDQDERRHGWSLAGIAIGILGVVLLLGIDLSGDATALLAGVMVLLAGLGYAVGAMFLKHRLPGAPPVGLAAATMLVSAAVTLPLAIAFPPDGLALDSAAALVALGAGGTGLAFLIFYTLIADVGPGRASIVAYIAPGFAVVYGVTLLGEPLTAGAIAGLVLILGGSWLGVEGRLPWRARMVALPEADLAVGGSPRLRALEGVEAVERIPEEPGDEPEPRVLRA
jgi:drug/metabolite transporter (DMT)-like permease